MSGICGRVGEAAPEVIEAMLARIDYRGDRQDVWQDGRAALAYRWWQGRAGRAEGVWAQGLARTVCCGTLAPPVDNLAADALDAPDLDGAFAAARWDGETLTLMRDPFGVRSLYYVEHAGTLYFASEVKQLLAIPGLPVQLDHAAIHKYLTFSFVPGEDVPIRGIKRVPPGHRLTYRAGVLKSEPYFELREQIRMDLMDRATAVRFLRQRCRQAVGRRLTGEAQVGLFLSGGLDSSAIALWLKRAGQSVQAYTLAFGEQNEAREVARHLEIPLHPIEVTGERIAEIFPDLVWRLDLPFGDAVTGPQYLLGQAARAAGLDVVFNGEGGDQLFGGWTAKPMVAAAIYADMYDGGPDSQEEIYLRSYHKFYGLEEELYTPEFRREVGTPGQRRALLAPYLGGRGAFLNRVRLADINLKGTQNILPRAERLTNGWGLDLRVPLFDRALAEGSFQVPPTLKLHGATEKFILKLMLRQALPEEIVWRNKSGMSVPITDWCLGPLRDLLMDLLGPASLARRGLFRTEYVGALLAGQDTPGEIRRRRVGERLWALAMLEGWMRRFVAA